MNETERKMEKMNEAEKRLVTIDALRSALTGGVSQASVAAQGVQEALKLFNDSLNDYLTLKLEYQAILDKYASKNPAGTGQSYNLPGVFNTALASYDVNAAKADNQRIMDLTPMIDEAEQQKNYYYDSLVGNFNDLVNALQKVKKNEGNITEYMLMFQQNKAL